MNPAYVSALWTSIIVLVVVIVCGAISFQRKTLRIKTLKQLNEELQTKITSPSKYKKKIQRLENALAYYEQHGKPVPSERKLKKQQRGKKKKKTYRSFSKGNGPYPGRKTVDARRQNQAVKEYFNQFKEELDL
jgi:hypothetical protein